MTLDLRPDSPSNIFLEATVIVGELYEPEYGYGNCVWLSGRIVWIVFMSIVGLFLAGLIPDTSSRTTFERTATVC